MELTVGQKVFLKPVNNAARYGDKEIREKSIMKIGRKYFFVGREDDHERFWTKFYVEDLEMVTNYSPDWQLYLSKQDILDEEESNKLVDEIRGMFGQWGKVGLTLDQLRRIKEIISE